MNIVLSRDKYSTLAKLQELDIQTEFPIPHGEVLSFHCEDSELELSASLIHRVQLEKGIWLHTFLRELPF
jgi:hypothetical protein